MTNTTHDRAWLEKNVSGPVLTPDDAGYAEETATFNRTLSHRPAVVVGATGPADVQAAVRYAARHDLAVAVNATGHGAVVSADGTLMITTRRMSTMAVDAVGRRARVGAGVRWNRFTPAAAEYGLAAITGSSPQVGAVGFTLGGGLSPVLGRSRGFGADHVRAFDLVTADGTLRRVDAGREPDLFWAARGGKGNFGVVTAMDFDLFPVTRLYGGGLYFAGEDAPAVLTAWREWAPGLPESLSTSFCLLRLPDLPVIPEPMRGRLTLHVRVAYLGRAEDGERLVAPLRAAAPAFIDTLGEMPYTEIATIHNDPAEPGMGVDRSGLLREFPQAALDELLALAGPDAPAGDQLMMTEIRLLGGALARPPAVRNAVGNREDAAYGLFVASLVAPDPEDIARVRCRRWRRSSSATPPCGPTPSPPSASCARPRPSRPRPSPRRLRRVSRAATPRDREVSARTADPAATLVEEGLAGTVAKGRSRTAGDGVPARITTCTGPGNQKWRYRTLLFRSSSVIGRTTRQGTPTATDIGGMSRLTTLPAPITEP